MSVGSFNFPEHDAAPAAATATTTTINPLKSTTAVETYHGSCRSDRDAKAFVANWHLSLHNHWRRLYCSHQMSKEQEANNHENTNQAACYDDDKRSFA